MREDSDYQNPISTQLEAWQNQIKEATPIFQDPDVNILNGGLFDSGFIFNGLPSSVPPQPFCQKCDGTMTPVSYTGIQGITYEYKK